MSKVKKTKTRLKKPLTEEEKRKSKIKKIYIIGAIICTLIGGLLGYKIGMNIIYKRHMEEYMNRYTAEEKLILDKMVDIYESSIIDLRRNDREESVLALQELKQNMFEYENRTVIVAGYVSKVVDEESGMTYYACLIPKSDSYITNSSFDDWEYIEFMMNGIPYDGELNPGEFVVVSGYLSYYKEDGVYNPVLVNAEIIEHITGAGVRETNAE